ncbi:TRAP transporter large permease subunit [Cognatishimia sp. SS12]|uniref:TRAP transporter large permease subunit n=1 Tax=Cognatishimia sp. SS12 TaxID=2979465 RepID=UPI00232BC841|nr:TRAP transporter large permease subunit [Cognatishimia sp. SS12]MDC0738893.1 TRAP transporter large permease subunit [Cognatishimia sp. SS12]
MELFFLALLLIIMAGALGSGYPVAFALPGAAIITIVLAAGSGAIFAGDMDAYFHSGGLSQWLTAGVTNLRGIYWEVERDTLIAIPLFIFMGIMLQRSKIAEDLLVAMAQLFGPVPGGLGISVVFVGALLAATTGILGATVVAMGMISLPAMLRNNYSKSLATGTIAASGTLGQIIPPSIVLIILADQLASATDQASSARKALHKANTGELSMPSAFDVTSTSAGEMFLGAFVPGILLVGIYMAYILIRALIKPDSAPTVPFDAKITGKYILKLLLTLVSPLALIFLVLGSIIGGIATVNQAGAIGAAGAIIMAGYRLKEGDRNTFYPAILALAAIALATYALLNYEMNIKSISSAEEQTGINIGIVATTMLIISLIWSGWRTYRIDNTLSEVMMETAKTTSLVFVILLGAAMLTAAFRAFGGEELVRHFLEGLPGGFWMKFTIVMLVIFVLGFFLDYIEIAVVVVPIVAPILLADPSANITAVWLGVMIGMNIQTSFLTPPFGFALFYLRGVAPAIVKTIDMYKGVIPFIGLQVLALAVVGLYPPLVNYLPNRVSLLSETAPPPRNPKLQYCLENYVADVFANDGAAVREAIAKGRGLDVSYLPNDLSSDLTRTFGEADQAFELMEAIGTTEADAIEAGEDYRPSHTIVRALQRDIRVLEAERDEAQVALDRARGDETIITSSEAKIAKAEAEIAELTAKIPADWADVQAAYAKFIKAEQDARNSYRRFADNNTDTLSNALGVIRDGEAYAALAEPLETLKSEVAAANNEDAMELIKEAESTVGAVNGTSEIRSLLSKARRALRGSGADPVEAMALIEEAQQTHAADVDWRLRAAAELTTPLTDVQAALANTIGLRSQDKLTREQALFLASCSSDHRDIGLNF